MNNKITIQDVKGQIKYLDVFGYETIHVIHCADNIEDLKKDVATPYLVFEYISNSARVHLVTDFSEDEALQQVSTYLFEKEGDDDAQLLGVNECVIL